MYKVKREIENGYILIDEVDGEEIEYKTNLPFRPGDRIKDIYDNVKMMNMYVSLLARQVLRLAEKDSVEYLEAKQTLIEEENNPTFLEGEKLIEFLAYRNAIDKCVG